MKYQVIAQRFNGAQLLLSKERPPDNEPLALDWQGWVYDRKNDELYKVGASALSQGYWQEADGEFEK